MSKKVYLISRLKKNVSSGPSNVVLNLVKSSDARGLNLTPLFLTENSSKCLYAIKLAKTVLFCKDAVINVHTDGFLLPLFVYILSKMNKSNSYYLTAHGIYKNQTDAIHDKKYNLYCKIEKILYTKFPTIICVSEMEKNDLISSFERTGKVIVIPNGTDATIVDGYREFKNNDNCIEMLFLGGLLQVKGYVKVLDFCDYCKKQKVNFHLSIYGHDSGNSHYFDEYVRTHSLEKNISYNGLLTDKKEVYQKIASSDFLLCFSKYDTFNVAIAEGLALGCPVIATNTCGASYLIKNGYNGLVFDYQSIDYNRILEFIDSLKKDTSKRKQVYKERIEYQARLSWDSIADMYSRLQ